MEIKHKLFQKAKEIEKEQIMRAFALGKAEVLMYEIGNRKDGEDYYNETHGKQQATNSNTKFLG